MMPSLSWKQYLKPLLIIAAFACLLPTIKHSVHDAAVLPAPKTSWLVLALLMFFVHYLVQAIGWHGILRAMDQKMPLAVSMRMYYMSMIARWMPGRVWYSATRLYLAQEAGISLTAVTFGIVLEMIYILLGGIVATLLFAGALLKGALETGGGQAGFAGLALIVAACSALVLRPGSLVRLTRFALFRKVVYRLTKRDLEADDIPVMSTGRSLGLLAFYTVFWIYSGVMFGVLTGAFLPMSLSIWLACIPAFAGSWLVGFFSIVTPAGLGAREGAMWLMLKPVMLPGQAAMLAVASRLMMLGTELLSVALMSLLLRRAGRVSIPLDAAAEASQLSPEPVVSGAS